MPEQDPASAQRRYSPAHLRTLPSLLKLTRCRPSPGTRLSRARSTTAAPPHPRLRQASRLSIPVSLARRRVWNARGWFPRSLSSDQRVRHPALPLRHRHGYAVDLHRGLQTQAKQTQPEVPLPLAAGRVRTANQPESTGFRAGIRSRGVTEPISHVYLPVSLTAPAPSGSTEPTRLCRGCSRPHRRPPAQASSSFTPPLRRRGDGGITPPSETSAPRGALRLPPASPHRCDGEEMDGLSPPSATTAPRGAPRR